MAQAEALLGIELTDWQRSIAEQALSEPGTTWIVQPARKNGMSTIRAVVEKAKGLG